MFQNLIQNFVCGVCLGGSTWWGRRGELVEEAFLTGAVPGAGAGDSFNNTTKIVKKEFNFEKEINLKERK